MRAEANIMKPTTKNFLKLWFHCITHFHRPSYRKDFPDDSFDERIVEICCSTCRERIEECLKKLKGVKTKRHYRRSFFEILDDGKFYILIGLLIVAIAGIVAVLLCNINFSTPETVAPSDDQIRCRAVEPTGDGGKAEYYFFDLTGDRYKVNQSVYDHALNISICK